MFRKYPRKLALTAVMIGSILGAGVLGVAAQDATGAPPQGFGGGSMSILDYGETDPTDSPLVIAAAEALGIDAETLVAELQAGKSLTEIAAAQNVDVLTVYTAMIDKEKQRLTAEVSAGYLTQEQADKQLETYSANITNVRLVRMEQGDANGGQQGNPPQGGDQQGSGGPQGEGGQPPQMPSDGTPGARPANDVVVSPLLTAVADALGLDAETLMNELMAGQSLTEIAAAQNVDIQTVYDAILAEQQKLLDAAVDSGYLTQEQGDELLASFTENIANFQIMAGGRGGGPGGNGGPGGIGARGGNGGPQGDGGQGQPPQPPSGG